MCEIKLNTKYCIYYKIIIYSHSNCLNAAPLHISLLKLIIYRNMPKVFYKNYKRYYFTIFRWNLINDDLFNLSSKYSIAHCISEDLKMFNGISSVFKYELSAIFFILNFNKCFFFRSKFGNIGVLMDKNLEVGHVGEIVCDTQYIFYLVVKKTESNTVSLHNFEKTLCNLVVRMKELGLKKLAIPKSEFDFYSSQKVKGLISKIFDKSDIEVSICTVTPVR